MLNLLWFLLSLGFVEAFVKPITTHFVRKYTLRWLPPLLKKLGPKMGHAIATLTPDELEQFIISEYAEQENKEVVTGKERSFVLREFNQAFSPVKAADKLSDREVG